MRAGVWSGEAARTPSPVGASCPSTPRVSTILTKPSSTGPSAAATASTAVRQSSRSGGGSSSSAAECANRRRCGSRACSVAVAEADGLEDAVAAGGGEVHHLQLGSVRRHEAVPEGRAAVGRELDHREDGGSVAGCRCGTVMRSASGLSDRVRRASTRWCSRDRGRRSRSAAASGSSRRGSGCGPPSASISSARRMSTTSSSTVGICSMNAHGSSPARRRSNTTVLSSSLASARSTSRLARRGTPGDLHAFQPSVRGDRSRVGRAG